MAERITRIWGLRRRPDKRFSVEVVGSPWGSTPADEIPSIARELEREADYLGESISRNFPDINYAGIAPPTVVLSGDFGKDKFGVRTAHFLQVAILFEAKDKSALRMALQDTGLYKDE